MSTNHKTFNSTSFLMIHRQVLNTLCSFNAEKYHGAAITGTECSKQATFVTGLLVVCCTKCTFKLLTTVTMKHIKHVQKQTHTVVH